LYQSLPRKYKLYGRPQKELLAFLEQTPEPALICIGSMMTYWLPGVAETVRNVAAVHPNAPICIGGAAARLMPDVFRKNFPGAMIGASLEGSKAMRLCGSLPPLKSGAPVSLLGGLQLLDKPSHGPILMSLGCPMACSYCASHLLQGDFRLRPIELVMQEIRYCIEHFRICNFSFYDDALLFRPDQGIVPLLDSLSSLRLSVTLHAPNGLHLRFIDDRIAGLLKAAGFATLRFGYESGLSGYGSDTSAKTTRREVKEKIACLKNAGFEKKEIGVYVMAGLEGQEPSAVVEEIEFIASLGVQAKPVYLSPVPGTALFERYALRFPQIRVDPFWHNDMFFITRLPGWSWEAVETIRSKVNELNK
jgi:hypothetical protein